MGPAGAQVLCASSSLKADDTSAVLCSTELWKGLLTFFLNALLKHAPSHKSKHQLSLSLILNFTTSFACSFDL